MPLAWLDPQGLMASPGPLAYRVEQARRVVLAARGARDTGDSLVSRAFLDPLDPRGRRAPPETLARTGWPGPLAPGDPLASTEPWGPWE